MLRAPLQKPVPASPPKKGNPVAVQTKCDCPELLPDPLLQMRGPATAAAAAPTGPGAPATGGVATGGTADGPRSDLFSLVRPRILAESEAELARVGRTARDCPYLEYWMGYYEGQSPARVERAIRAYTQSSATTPVGLADAVAARVRAAVRTWAATGEVTGVPAASEIESAISGDESKSGKAGSNPVARAAVQPRADGRDPMQAGGTGDDVDPVALWARLDGHGVPLPAATRERMERGLGGSFGDVRVHTDATAAALASSLRARAFAVGEHVAFAAGQYRPGSVGGDILLAHELAHTIQQQRGVDSARSRGEDIALERDADRAAIGAVSHLWGGADAPARADGAEEGTPEPKRAGLRLQRCDLGSTGLEPAPGKVPDYDAFSDADGTVPAGKVAALGRMMANSDQLEQVFADAAGGKARAKGVVAALESIFHGTGIGLADKVYSAACSAPVVRELKPAFDGQGCVPDWSYLDFLSKTRPGGLKLRETIALSYSQRSRELKVRNDIIIGALNLLLAGWAVRSALANEARALKVEVPKPPAVYEKPPLVAIPDELKGLTGSEAAAKIGLPSPPPGYRWAKTGDGKLAVARNPGTAADAPKLNYNPETKAFEREPVVPPKEPVVPATPTVASEFEGGAKQALDARDAIKGVPARKTGARAPDGTTTESGWGSDVHSLDPVKKFSEDVGHPLQPNPALDAPGNPGSYNLSHAEKKLAVQKPNQPIGVSREMCLDCQRFFQRVAQKTGRPQVVADPTGVRVFLPNGSVASAVTASAAAAAAAALAKDQGQKK